MIIIGIVVIIAIAGFIKFNILQDDIYIQQPDGSVVRAVDIEEYMIVTESGTAGVFSYTSKDKDTATLNIDGEFHQLERVVSASGSKYANEDGSVTYWESQGSATIEMSGETTNVSTIEKADILTFSIAPNKQDCVGVAPMKCLVVNGDLFYDSIEGFEFEEGTEYEITVARTERENVPADASKYKYRRVEVLKSNKQGDPDANKYDFSIDDLDDDCDDPQDDGTCRAIDDDSDGDSIPIEDEASVVNDENPLAVDGLTWTWIETQYSNDDVVEAADNTQFVATFLSEGQFSSTTDCNNTFGEYTIEGNNLSFGPLASTKKACLGETQEMEYLNMLSEVTSYMIDDNGRLVLMLKYDTGSMIFTPQSSDSTGAQEATNYNSSRSNKNF